MRIQLLRSGAFAALIALIATSAAFAHAQQETGALRFGTLPAESAVPLIYAREQGLFRYEGVDVDLVAFNSPNDRNVAAEAGQIDGFVADIMTAITLNEAGFPVRMTSDINEDFKLLTAPRSGIDSFRKLSGKDVSLVPNYVLEYIMDYWARQNDITYHTVVIPSISERFEALMAGRISAVVFTEPQASLLEAGGARVLADSRESGLTGGAILFTQKSLSSKPAEVRRFYRALDTAVDRTSGRNLKDFASMLAGYGFPENVTNALHGTLDFDRPQPISAESFSGVEEWMIEKGTLKGKVTLSQVSDFSFLE